MFVDWSGARRPGGASAAAAGRAAAAKNARTARLSFMVGGGSGGGVAGLEERDRMSGAGASEIYGTCRLVLGRLRWAVAGAFASTFGLVCVGCALATTRPRT